MGAVQEALQAACIAGRVVPQRVLRKQLTEASRLQHIDLHEDGMPLHTALTKREQTFCWRHSQDKLRWTGTNAASAPRVCLQA